MRVILKPIVFDERSFNVALLHQVLRTFGLQVAASEVAEHRAGTDTRDKLRALQMRLNLPVDESVLVDEDTALAITEALEKRRLTATDRAFSVSGTVKRRSGEAKERQRLLAFDLDLRGVAVYRRVKDVAEIQRNGGFEFLGQTRSNSKGMYHITFYDWQYAQAERKKADVVVYAVDGEQIIGCSRIVNSEDYSEKGSVRGLDVVITREDSRTEYQMLMEPLKAFLKESKTTLGDIAQSYDQLVFTAGELDISQPRLNIAARAESLSKSNRDRRRLTHELLYGLGRQNIKLSWMALFKKQEEELRRAIAKSVEARIIQRFDEQEIAAFLKQLRDQCAKHLLNGSKTNGNGSSTLGTMLSHALPKATQRAAFLGALRDFKGTDFREFWNEHLPSQPEFQENPALISGLLMTQQLTLLSGNHQTLVKELQVNRKVTSTQQLIQLEHSDWIEIIKKAGVPDFIQGKTDEDKINTYAQLIESLLNAAFPTQRIARMVECGDLNIEKTKVSTSIHKFLSNNETFDLARSRIYDFEEQLKAEAGTHFDEVRSELMKIQRVFQVSASPENMPVLLENNLTSAYTIANIPRKSFIKTYGEALGSDKAAFAIHQRASHISTKTEMAAMYMRDYTHGIMPKLVGRPDYTRAVETIENHIPNYSELFGSPDICECDECRSVYSAAAYFIDLLRFLWRSVPNSDGKSPLDMLAARRPDLLYLLLTCENTNTIIPYIDLANEVMEYYVAHDSLASYEGYDTGEATAEELRANPQNFDLEAYRKLKDANYPFNLPYHQPLDVIRTYSNHLKVSRYEAMKVVNPEPDSTTTRVIEAESLALCEEEYRILTGESFDGLANAAALQEYFGYSSSGELENMSGVREFLQRSGIEYTDLVDLIETLFINPYQSTLDFLQTLFSYVSIDANEIYARLEQIEAGTLDPASDPDIAAALMAYAADTGASITTAEFTQWVNDHLGEFRQVITLYEPESKCDLDTTSLKTIQNIYEASSSSGLTSDTWSKIHRFIRLWMKLGWTIHETDLMLAALGQDDLTTDTISMLESASLLETATRLPLNKLAVLWGNIDTYGDKSLYKKLFLNKAVQQIDEAFNADAWGNYLRKELDENGDPITLANHQSAILAAFRITEDELTAIMNVAQVVDGGTPRLLILDTDLLNIQNLSTIYRYVVLAKAVNIRIADLCTLITLFNASPFSTWDVQQEEFTAISPVDTYEFYTLAAATKSAGFKSSVLEYILQGSLPADSNIGLNKEDVLKTASDICTAFAAIEQDHPAVPEAPWTSATLSAELSLTFQPTAVATFMQIVESTASFEAITDANLTVIIPDELVGKYSYIKGSGRLTCAGIMTDDERSVLKGLPGTNANFIAAIDKMYSAPETILSDNFNGIFADLAKANRILLDHPQQVTAATLDEKLTYIYQSFLPVLKSKLRQDVITQHIAALIGLTEEAAAVLIADNIASLMTNLSTVGFGATYFSDATWSTAVLDRVDPTIDFSWGESAPDPLVPADNFSVRWNAYLAAPASGEYTLVLESGEADEAFNLYLDGVLVLQKTSSDASTSWELVTDLNAAQLHQLTLEYAEATHEAGIHLYWKTATTALEIIPASVAYPAAILDDFVGLATLFHRAAKFILGFELSETELNHVVTFKTDFDSIDFKALKAGDWQRIYDYTSLRSAVPQAQALLTDIFALANTPDPVPVVDDLRALLYLATAWDEASLEYLVDTHFALNVDDFKNEIALNHLYDVMKVVSKTGLTAETIVTWGAGETDFDTLDDTAQLMKNAVKAKYEDEDWLDVAGGLSDKIRENQQQALVSYLLTQPSIQAWGAEDADSLFEYFLIDVQMGACMDTSRIVQANSSVQMFINRCLLNLESDMASNGDEKGVSPGAIDRDRWDWMKNYRVWEANRQVFLYPENWLEPEWRTDRSEFFKNLESYLVQNDITDTSVEQAFRNYLTSLNEVANLEVCGIHQEYYDDGTAKYLHVFGRTRTAPYKFFYRTWDEYMKWSAWETVPVDIRCVEDGESSGVHLIPVVWKQRLFLFWPEFIEKQAAATGTSTQNVSEAFDKPLGDLESSKYWEVRLAWSEYVDGKWSPKQVTREYLEEAPDEHFSEIKDLLFTASIASDTQELSILLSNAYLYNYMGAFILPDIQSPAQTYNTQSGVPNTSTYELEFSYRTAYAELELDGNTYLQTSATHKLLPVDTMQGRDITLETPFFYSDICRTYFVRPVVIRIIDRLKDSDAFQPFLPHEVPDLIDDIPIDVPHVDPDDYRPGELEMGLVGAGSSSRAPLVGSAPLGTAMALGGSINPGGPVMPMMLRSGSAPSQTKSSASVLSKTNGTAIPHDLGSAFADYVANSMGTLFSILGNLDTGLEFHTFYHPFSSEFVKNLNQGGFSNANNPHDPPGLMESDTIIAADDGTTFESTYDPNFTNGYVTKYTDFATPPTPRTAYQENVCFDVYGANSLYNWELFFHAPLYIATRLSKNGKYEEAMKWFHYIFDPTTDETPESGQELVRYWKVQPFRDLQAEPVETLEDWFTSLLPSTDPSSPENDIISEWRDNPFDPHLVASDRPIAYMKNVVIKYVENLIAWGDSLFRQDTMESVNEALQLYVMANHVLGPSPEFVPERGEIKSESYYSLQDKWDDFSNALVELENIFPYSSNVNVSSSSTGTNLLGIGSALYFCIPPNDKLLETWDTVADRLFKIRHCQNIEGAERKLALFAPPISPAALIQAISQGLSLGSILADLSSPPPIYRFSQLIQKANEFCAEVKALGSSLLATLEKKDGEELGRLRASHETQMLDLMTAVKERQILDARASKENLEKARASAAFRLQHYLDLLGNDSVTIPAAPTISASLTADSQLPADTTIGEIKTDIDDSLVDSDESGVKLIPREQSEIEKLADANSNQERAGYTELGSNAVVALIPNAAADGKPFGVGAGVTWGGSNLSLAAAAVAKYFQIQGANDSLEAGNAAKFAGYIRREQDWTLQANLAAKEIIQLDKQLTSADIRIQIAEKELANHQQQILNAQQVELFLKGKFTNQELYQWMKEQLYAVYKQSYNLAFDMAKKAEKAYKYERGTETASFIQYGYWDNSKQGLAAGEKLQLALRQLEKSYLEENRRELELTKSISLAMLNPLALIQLRETGRCYVSLPEELFDLDFQGHYFRRIKSVSVSIPCVVGPYTTLNCSLRLLNNSIRINTTMNSQGDYEHENDEGIWIDDDRFRTNNVPVTSIATSTGQNDTGLFEFNFRDERYLPFEGAGAISDWVLELATEMQFRQFDYSTISDVILHVKFTARESGGLFKDGAVAYVKNFLMNTAELEDQPLLRLFTLKQEFPTQWYQFLHPTIQGNEQVLNFTLGQDRFPFFIQGRDITVMKIDAFAKCNPPSSNGSPQAMDYTMVLTYTNIEDDIVTSNEITMPVSTSYGDLNKTSLNVNDAGLNLEEMDVTKPMSLKLKRSTALDYKGLTTEPSEVDNLFLVLHYKLGV